MDGQGPHPMDADPQKEEILRMLQEGADALAHAVHGVTDSEARRRPAPASWSILECVEHIAASEAALLSRLRDAKPSDRSCEDRAREAKFHDLALNRLRRIEAPEPVVPKGISENLAQALKDFHAIRSQTLMFVREFPGDLRWWLTTHPLITRPLNCYEMLLLMALHPQRHAQQITEIRVQLSHSQSQKM